jgi:hypothetical protein
VSPSSTALAARPLRLLPAPDSNPPYDDERRHDHPVDGTLALAFPPVAVLPLRLVPPAQAAGPAADDGPPEPRAWTARLAQAMVEVFVGARSAAQLSPFATLDVLHQLERATGRLGAGPGQRTRRPHVRSVHVSHPRPGVAEACAVLDLGVRHRAIALRLDERRGRWVCTALHLG